MVIHHPPTATNVGVRRYKFLTDFYSIFRYSEKLTFCEAEYRTACRIIFGPDWRSGAAVAAGSHARLLNASHKDDILVFSRVDVESTECAIFTLEMLAQRQTHTNMHKFRPGLPKQTTPFFITETRKVTKVQTHTKIHTRAESTKACVEIPRLLTSELSRSQFYYCV